MNKAFALACALIVSLYAHSQYYGVYVTANDFANNTPVKGTALKETSGAGPSNLVLTLPDGSKRTFKSGSFWGFYRSLSKKDITVTEYRCYQDELYPIYTAGEIIAYFDNKSQGHFEANDKGGISFRFYDVKPQTFISNGPNKPIIGVSGLGDLKKYMDPGLYEKTAQYLEENSSMNLVQIIEHYNVLAAKAAKENR